MKMSNFLKNKNIYYKNTSNDKLKEEELSQVTVAFIGWATHVLQ